VPQFVVQAIKTSADGREKISYVMPSDNRYFADNTDGAALYTCDGIAQTVRDNMQELHPTYKFKVVAVKVVIDKKYDRLD